MGKSQRQRAVEQRSRSKQDREKAAELRKPSRDDVARTALWFWIWSTWHFDKDARETIDIIRNQVVDQLVAQGFDLRQSEERFEELAAKYKSNLPPFRIKRHLQSQSEIGATGQSIDDETG